MNLYDLHSKPETLKGYEQRFEVPEIAYKKALETYAETGKRSPDLEPTIAKDSATAYDYAVVVLNQRFPLGEPAIAKASSLAHNYIVKFIKGRFPEAEPAIAKDSHNAAWYAIKILKKQWPEAEPAIAKNFFDKTIYQNHFGVEI